MSANAPTHDAESPADLHTFPAWFQWARDNWFMSALIIAEMYLMATGGSEGWVPQLDNIHTWGWYHGVGVVLFFLACASTAGIALGLSLAASYAAASRHIVRAFFCAVGSLFFALLEVIINLSERSWNLKPSPFDSWFLALIHAPTNLPFTPTLLATSLLLPATTFAYGWAKTPKVAKQIKSVAEIEAEAAAKAAEDEAKRRKRLADADAAFKQRQIKEGRLTLADLQRQEAAERAALAQVEQTDRNDQNDQNDQMDDDHDDGLDDDATYGAPASPSQPLPLPVGIPKNYWQAKDLITYVRDTYGKTLSEGAARAMVQSAKGAVRYERVAGQPWAASRSVLKRTADRQCGPAVVPVVANG